MTFLDKHIGSDGRKYDRFAFKDKAAWTLWLNHRSIESEWVLDLNSVGMQILIETENAPQIDEELKIQILLQGHRVILCEAKVKWVRSAGANNDLSSVGLEFIDPFYRVAKSWQEAGLRAHLVKR